MKEREENMLEYVIKKIVKRRLQQYEGILCLRRIDPSIPLLEEISSETKKLLKLNDYYSNIDNRIMANISRQKGFEDGLLYTENLINDEKYNLDSIVRVTLSLPKCFGYILFGDNYTKGFFQGLFADYTGIQDYCDDSDYNWFVIRLMTSIWKNKIIKECLEHFKTAS